MDRMHPCKPNIDSCRSHFLYTNWVAKKYLTLKTPTFICSSDSPCSNMFQRVPTCSNKLSNAEPLVSFILSAFCTSWSRSVLGPKSFGCSILPRSCSNNKQKSASSSLSQRSAHSDSCCLPFWLALFLKLGCCVLRVQIGSVQIIELYIISWFHPSSRNPDPLTHTQTHSFAHTNTHTHKTERYKKT